MNTTTQTYDATDKKFVDASIVVEVTAREIAHLASKMPYVTGEEARDVYDYLSDRFGFNGFRSITGIESPSMLVERTIVVRAAAENAVTA